jgi:integrase
LPENNASKNQLAVQKQKTSRYPSSYSTYANSHNNTIIRYVTNVLAMSKSTAYQYYARLSNFETFASSENKTSIDHLIGKIREGFFDPYDILSNYCAFLQNSGDISISTLNQRVVTAKNFLEYCDVDISPRRFEIKVKLPKTITKNKEALSKEDIIDILNACSDIRLKTYVIFLASTGCRAVEALSIRYVDLDLDTNPARVLIRGEYTKTRVDRLAFLTTETAKQLKLWLEYKHRTTRVCHKDMRTGRITTEYRTPTQNPNGLIFAVHQKNANPIPDYLYGDFRAAFAKTLDRIGKDSFEDNKRRRKITLHSFRRFVKSTISDLGYADFSEYFIGHSGSTYYRKTDKEKVEIFRKIELYLTFLDFVTLERKGSDTQARIEGLEAINQTLRQKDSMNTDAISTLSDQLSKVMQEIEILKKNGS